ncbi:crossover junction endodeoxyribonuclease RuvC [Streptomyces sp. CoH17]|uniref:crossover junction endodeoxyribonuclease RuvC n=1 Tax=Streptomyces sp. CoH17 TaxID=2992806 RepID=UPI002271DAC7|nr:crossover junction endodeoxyribonuclease RuvC [Streptomyces sp. CoH17]
MTLLSVDPGSSKMGYGIHDGDKLVHWGIVTPHSDRKTFNNQMNDKMQQVLWEFGPLFKKYEIDQVAWEIVPVQTMGQRDLIQSCLSTIKSLTFLNACTYVGLTPMQMKKLVTGDSKASKGEIREAVFAHFPEFPVIDQLPWDVYDGIAVGIAAKKLRLRDWWPAVSNDVTRSYSGA